MTWPRTSVHWEQSSCWPFGLPAACFFLSLSLWALSKKKRVFNGKFRVPATPHTLLHFGLKGHFTRLHFGQRRSGGLLKSRRGPQSEYTNSGSHRRRAEYSPANLETLDNVSSLLLELRAACLLTVLYWAFYPSLPFFLFASPTPTSFHFLSSLFSPPSIRPIHFTPTPVTDNTHLHSCYLIFLRQGRPSQHVACLCLLKAVKCRVALNVQPTTQNKKMQKMPVT